MWFLLGVHVQYRSDKGELLDAARRGRVAKAEEILQRPQDPDFLAEEALLDDDEPMGFSQYLTPLVAASYHGHSEVARLLLEARARLYDDRSLRRGYSALQAAAMNDQAETLSLLLEEACDSPLYINLLDDSLSSATHNGSAAIVEMLLEARASADPPDPFSSSHLCRAAWAPWGPNEP